ncbi:amino acid permease [Bacillus sp. FSL K6-2841]|uniref:amino acid permease n=1 Tax=Bacillus TaxID=1386 RepID=UPI0030D555DD
MSLKQKGVAHALKEEQTLSWWQLSLIGVGCTIGTGFFLGSSIAITKSGFSVCISFLLAAVGTYLVFKHLAAMTADNPDKGSFCSYARKAYGRWAGFSNGWVYWFAEMLITGSQLTAISLFTRHWFPSVPLWVFSAIYSALALLVIIIGLSSFQKTENVLAVLKTAAIFLFMILAVLVLFGILTDHKPTLHLPNKDHEWMPLGALGLWNGLIYAFYAFGGIEVMGLMAVHLKDPKDAAKSGRVMLMILAVIYIVSIGLALLLVPVTAFNENSSPFITSLEPFHLSIFLHIFNGIFIIAGFSTLVASLYAVTTLLGTMSEHQDAPACFKQKDPSHVGWPSIILTAAGLIVSILLALFLSKHIYEHLTTAAGLTLLYTWVFILFSSKKLSKPSTRQTCEMLLALLLIGAAISGTLTEASGRPGFFISLGIIAVIAIMVLFMRRKWKQQDQTAS